VGVPVVFFVIPKYKDFDCCVVYNGVVAGDSAVTVVFFYKCVPTHLLAFCWRKRGT